MAARTPTNTRIGPKQPTPDWWSTKERTRQWWGSHDDVLVDLLCSAEVEEDQMRRRCGLIDLEQIEEDGRLDLMDMREPEMTSWPRPGQFVEGTGSRRLDRGGRKEIFFWGRKSNVG
ncbi:hypothetical protein VPH35_046873 [Triticum aestivum]